MKKIIVQYFKGRLAGLRRDEGFVVMSTLAIFLFIFILCAFVYAVGETIHQRIRMQNACDAAAYSAAVIQADGLSRMAVVNRAMAWSYVQMTNRQMDYITYRWLKLTCKRFGEDLENAEEYNDNLVLAVDKELGWWALLEAAVSGVISYLLDLDCSGYLGGDVVAVEHGEEGHGWWCGLEVDNRTGHIIRLNHPKNEKFTSQLVTSGIETLTDKLTTYDNLKKLLSLFKFLDEGDNPAGWGERLGKLIDYDKTNIESLNGSLARINNQMNASMKMTAESVLKAMLRDPRVDPSSALNDYYISIHIPEGKNPYASDSDKKSAAPQSFFSPLHNTEAEEMLFLNMPSAGATSKSLIDHFPILGPNGLACGLDQWFIRGKGLYSDGKDHSAEAASKKPKFAKSPKFHQATMVRDEGMHGIQRVYKDANLNENGAGFISDGPSDNGSAVWRGNHLLDAMNITNNLATMAKGLLNGASSGGGGSKSSSGGITNREDLDARLKEIHDGAQEEGKESPFDNPLDNPEHGGASANAFGNQSSSDMGAMEAGVNLITNAISNVVGNMIGNFLDVHPSCENEPGLDYGKFPMCKKITEPTSALYSEYRWGSGKWICATKAFTYLVCLVFDYPDIYCDYPSADLEISFLGISVDISVDGYLHFGFPKWFCGHDPSGAFVIPPLIPRSISGGKHGYMDNNITDLTDGFIRPMKALWGDEGERTFSRDEYESCAMFFDGIGDCIPILGHVCYPGLIRGHARIYGDDKEIFNNRYVGANCKPWVLNERFFAGDGTIVVGAAMKHTNPLIQLMNLWNPNAGTQEDAEKTVLSAFNIPKGNYMMTMAAARAGVRHTRRNGEFDQERQYQITYDSSCDPENLSYNSSAYVYQQDGDKWGTPEAWGGDHDDNPNAISRFYNPDKKQEEIPIWNGCPCGKNPTQFRNLWNLCETDWDATLLPLRYATRKAVLYTDKNGSQAFNDMSYSERCNFVQNDGSGSVIGNGSSWKWDSLAKNPTSLVSNNPFIKNGWKPAGASFFEDMFHNAIPGELSTGISSMKEDGLNLNSKVPTGKEEKTIDVFTILKDRVL
jgi:hypothetical protein